jgi:hypothetical protein
MPIVTLFPADSAEDEAAPRLELELPLDAEGRVTGSGPHPARRIQGTLSEPGECVSDAETGHFLRFPPGPDAPVHGVFDAAVRFRPGDAVLLRRGHGGEETWRVVSSVQ